VIIPIFPNAFHYLNYADTPHASIIDANLNSAWLKVTQESSVRLKVLAWSIWLGKNHPVENSAGESHPVETSVRLKVIQ